jgi:heme exporter protein D
MTWLSLALTLLKIVSSIMKAIAETTQEILRKTAVGKQLMEQVDAMSDSQVDDALRNLEPK